MIKVIAVLSFIEINLKRITGENAMKKSVSFVLKKGGEWKFLRKMSGRFI
jgi:hypothetical protein